MPWFEIEPQGSSARKRKPSVHVEAETWMDALKDGTQKLRPGAPMLDIQVHFEKDGAISVLQPEDGVRVRIVQLDRPPNGAADVIAEPLTEPGVVRATAPLGPRPKLTAAAPYPTITGSRPSLPPPPHLRAEGEGKDQDATDPEGEPLGKTGGRGAMSGKRNALLKAPKFELSTEELARVKRACFGGWSQKAADGLLQLAMELVPSQAGSTYQTNQATGDLELVAAWGPRASKLLETGLTLKPGEGLAGFSVQQGVLVLVRNPEEDPRFRKDLAEKIGYPVGSALVSPLWARGAAVGCVQLLNRKSGPFTDLDAVKLSQLTRAAAGFLEKGAKR